MGVAWTPERPPLGAESSRFRLRSSPHALGCALDIASVALGGGGLLADSGALLADEDRAEELGFGLNAVSGGLGLDSVALGIQEEYKRELEESEEGRTEDSDGTRSAGGNGASALWEFAALQGGIQSMSPAQPLHCTWY